VDSLQATPPTAATRTFCRCERGLGTDRLRWRSEALDRRAGGPDEVGCLIRANREVLDFQHHPERWLGSSNFISFVESKRWFDLTPAALQRESGVPKWERALPTVRLLEQRLRRKLRMRRSRCATCWTLCAIRSYPATRTVTARSPPATRSRPRRPQRTLDCRHGVNRHAVRPVLDRHGPRASGVREAPLPK
jgi:hypothetical protein